MQGSTYGQVETETLRQKGRRQSLSLESRVIAVARTDGADVAGAALISQVRDRENRPGGSR